MSKVNSGLGTAFIDQQRKSLDKLRVALLSAAQNSEADEVSVNAESRGGPREPEDDAQKLSALELDGQLVARDIMHLVPVERALAKIEEGTYGLSDISGLPIPRARLEAIQKRSEVLNWHERLRRASVQRRRMNARRATKGD
jgi:DnaK suppressor protein